MNDASHTHTHTFYFENFAQIPIESYLFFIISIR